MSATKLAEKKFVSHIVSDNSFGRRELGKHESTMVLYATEQPGHAFIEWEIRALDMGEEINLWFDVRRNLLEYDGVFSLPREAVALIRRAGLKVGKEFVA